MATSTSMSEWLVISGISSRAELVHIAKLAEQAERYEDMALAITSVTKKGQELDNEERNLLSVAYKNIVRDLLSSWRAISSIEIQPEEKANEKMLTMATKFRQQIETELHKKCTEIVKLLEDYLIETASCPESKVFYYKMQGDYMRYLAEVSTGEGRKLAMNSSELAYRTATECAEAELPTTHPIRLGVALNYSVFFYEIKNDLDKACLLADGVICVVLTLHLTPLPFSLLDGPVAQWSTTFRHSPSGPGFNPTIPATFILGGCRGGRPGVNPCSKLIELQPPRLPWMDWRNGRLACTPRRWLQATMLLSSSRLPCRFAFCSLSLSLSLSLPLSPPPTHTPLTQTFQSALIAMNQRGRDTSDENFKDSALIMQLLRDNITLWTAEQGGDDSEQ